MLGKNTIGAWYLCLVMLMGFSGCDLREQSDVQLTVRAMNHQGEPVAGSLVSVNDVVVGETNQAGQLTFKQKYYPKDELKIKIQKDSNEFYFAPYMTQINVTDQAKQNHNVKAVLYYVPKPSAKDDTPPPAATAEVPPPAPPKEAIPAETVKVEPIEDIEDEPAESLSNNDAEETEKEGSAEDDPAEASAADLAKEVAPKKAVTLPENTRAEIVPTKPLAPAPTLFNVYVYNNKKPVPNAHILIGLPHAQQLQDECETNQQGRCILRFTTPPQGRVTIVAKKPGFQTKIAAAFLKHLGTQTINLNVGHSIDVFALTQNYQQIRGVALVDVTVQGSLVGKTNAFGFLTYPYSGKKGDLVEVQLQSKTYLPHTYSTDFVVSGAMALTRYYSPVAPTPARIAVMPTRVAGTLTNQTGDVVNQKLDLNLSRAVRKQLFQNKRFVEAPIAPLAKAAERSGINVSMLSKQPWTQTEAHNFADMVLVPTLVEGSPKSLEISLIDQRAVTITAAKEDLNSLSAQDLAIAMQKIIPRLIRDFPFEGTVTQFADQKITFNLGQRTTDLQPGQTLSVWGSQKDKFGQNIQFERIAEAKITKVEAGQSVAEIGETLPRSLLAIGDKVVLHARSAPQEAAAYVVATLKDQDDKSTPVEQANVYFNDQWLGATDKNGRVFLNKKVMGLDGSLKVIKEGFQDFTHVVSLRPQVKIEVPLKREMAFLRIESEPKGAVVKVDGKTVGKTPLATPLPVPTGFVKVELDGVNGYKAYSNVLELDQGTLELIGERKINLEKDLLKMAMKLMEDDKIDAAMTQLAAIPPEHSDALLAKYNMATIYLNNLEQPAKAAQLFHELTSVPSIQSFSDKRFIGAHLNEGIALFLTADTLAAQDKAAAIANYQQAAEAFERVTPHIRFIAADELSQATYNIGFYKALTAQKLWNLTQDVAQLQKSHQLWQDYMSEIARDQSDDEDLKSMAEDARIYMKQVQASLAASGVNGKKGKL